MISIIDYGNGNFSAIANIFKKLKINHQITKDKKKIANSDKYILPGVGSFDNTIYTLNKSGILDILEEEVLVKKKPILGICIGMQILSNESEEGELRGLGWIPGKVKKFNKLKLKELNLYLPHMGWNSIEKSGEDNSLLKNINLNQGFYFLHSYHFVSSLDTNSVAISNFDISFSCIVRNENIYGVQFHPEKSHDNGIQLLLNFANL